MFGKNKSSKETEMPEIKTVVAPPPVAVAEDTVREEKQNNTVISQDVRFEGNIIACGQVYIYGEVHGNIESDGGIVKVMRSGRVEGNILCRELIIDGAVDGQCRAETVDVYENGKVTGTLNYSALSVKKGGTVSGQIDHTPSEKAPAKSKTTPVIPLHSPQPTLNDKVAEQ
ncbi:bactofilin family protein [Entomohabitans teleogrylli]|uniref:bactofilin family protein n=1 Tax=Entomohabitans teleogrylli TaxID=1384589 RepID=UPI00073D8D57|nr:polymer-forming cytoskeletal protein [Entomohabitans teleogrylli]